MEGAVMGRGYNMFRVERLGVVFITPCPRCRGEGWLFDDHECGRCSGTGELVWDGMWLHTLAHNLAIGAALCRAFLLGHNTGWTGLGTDDCDWHPGCGRQAP
jgi:hypothetical protein